MKEKASVIPFLIFTIMIVLIFFVSNYYNVDKYDKFCKELGYNKSNGHRNIGGMGQRAIIKVKCDGKVIHHYDCRRDDICCSRDEYGACKGHDWGLVCDNLNEQQKRTSINYQPIRTSNCR